MNRFIEGLSRGLAIGVGMAIVLAIFIYFQTEEDSDEPYVPKYKEIDVSSVTVLSSRLIDFSEQVRVSVNLKNNSDKKLERVTLSVGLFDKSGLYGDCVQSIEDVLPNSEVEGSVRCYDFENRKIPKDTRAEVKVTEVSVLNDP